MKDNMTKAELEVQEKDGVVTEKVEMKIPYSQDPYEERPELYVMDEEDIQKEKEFFDNFKKNKYHQDTSRISNIYGYDKNLKTKKQIKAIWDKFKEEELADFTSANSYLSVKEIIDVGIDKFIYTMGITKPKHVASWKNHVVNIKVCGNCKDEFIPMMIQQNGGLCKRCAKEFSFEALQYFWAKESEKERDVDSQLYGGPNVMINVLTLFVNDDRFRNLFKKDSDFVNDLLKEKNKNEVIDIEVLEDE